MRGSKLPPELIERALYLECRLWSHAQIAAELGVCRETVQRTLRRINRRAAARLVKRRAELKARQIRQLEWLAGQAAEAWERSRADAEMTRTSTEQIGAEGDALADVEVTKTVKTVKGQSGNPALLRECREALADVREILGPETEELCADEDFTVIDVAPREADPPLETDGAPA